MRYYIIINGVNSLTIPGLAIKTLPPISKPAMRNLREEIDGRDGDITTELGYGAYDRPLEIGLFGDYDINKIISFFNSKGTIIFSDEPDKYYNFEIVDKIDYTKLVKFRTATINIHCQPFKYPVSEEPQVEEYEYVEATGSNVTLDNTSEAIFNKIDLIGNTEQTQYTGYQLFDFSNVARTATKNGVTYTINDDGSITITGTPTTYTSFYFRGITLPAGTYYANQIITRNANAFMQAIGDYSVIGTGRSFTIDEQKSASWYLVIHNSETGVAQNETLYPMLKKDSNPTTYEPYVGGIPSPNPNYPQDIHVVSGDNTIEITGRNLFNKDTQDYIQHRYIDVNGNLTTSDNWGVYYIPIRGNQAYTISGCQTNGGVNFYWYDKNKQPIARLGEKRNQTNKTSPSNAAYLGLSVVWNTSSSAYDGNTLQVEPGSNVSAYEAFESQSLPLNLGNLEMASSPNGEYRDFFSKEEDKWYINKVMKKVTLTGTENWTYQSNAYAFYNPRNDMLRLLDYRGAIIADHFTTAKGIGSGQTETSITGYSNSSTYEGQNWLYVRYDGIGTAQDLKNYFANNNTIVFYPLVTPTKTEITSETLADQLDAIKNAISYSGQTNVSQTNNDGPFILDLSALKEGSDHLVINNAGNIYAKPTMDIEGTGVVDIYLNDVQILEADLTETNNIVIDTEAMEAYNPDTNALANRQVTGDYSKIKLEPGENDLRFSGDLSKATVTKYKRWL